MTLPLVSIGVPVRNGEAFIRDCLEALITQEFGDLEILVCDNASEDGTRAIAEELAARDRRVRVLGADRNLGAARNFNRAFRASRGRYFRWNAVDDRWGPATLAACVAALESDPGAALAFPRGRFLAPDGTAAGMTTDFISGRDLEGSRRDRVRGLLRAAYRDGRAAMSMVFGLFRREALESTSLFRKVYGSDCTLLFEVAIRGRIIEVEDAEATFIVSPGLDSWARKTFDAKYQQEFWNPPYRGRVRAGLDYRRRYADTLLVLLRAPLPPGDRAALAWAAAGAELRHLAVHEAQRASARWLRRT